MKGNPQVIAALKAAAGMEAHLALQLQLDSRSLRQTGLKSVAKDIKKFSCDARWFLKKVTDRILFLEGDPSYDPDPIEQQSDVSSLISNALELEMQIVEPYERAVATATAALDDTTRNLFEHLLKWHQEHIAQLEQWRDQISTVGINDFITANI